MLLQKRHHSKVFNIRGSVPHCVSGVATEFRGIRLQLYNCLLHEGREQGGVSTIPLVLCDISQLACKQRHRRRDFPELKG